MKKKPKPMIVETRCTCPHCGYATDLRDGPSSYVSQWLLDYDENCKQCGKPIKVEFY